MSTTSAKAIVPHLHFDGVADKAITLYERALGAKVLAKMRWAEMPGGEVAAEDRDRIMHARLEVGKASLLIADRSCGGGEVPPGGNGVLMVEYEDAAEMDRRFAALAQDGKITMPIDDVFWGARFGQLVDAFGVCWMFHCEKKPA
jgi:PhnB protein